MDVIVKMAEGNPGATVVMAEMLKADPDNLMLILSLDDMNIRGSQIWVGHKDYCGAMREGDKEPLTKEEQMKRFIQAIKDRDPKMIEKINEECFHPDLEFEGYKEKAVTHGASWDHLGAAHA